MSDRSTTLNVPDFDLEQQLPENHCLSKPFFSRESTGL